MIKPGNQKNEAPELNYEVWAVIDATSRAPKPYRFFSKRAQFLEPLNGRPPLASLIRFLRASSKFSRIVVLTTCDAEDRAIIDVARSLECDIWTSSRKGFNTRLLGNIAKIEAPVIFRFRPEDVYTDLETLEGCFATLARGIKHRFVLANVESGRGPREIVTTKLLYPLAKNFLRASIGSAESRFDTLPAETLTNTNSNISRKTHYLWPLNQPEDVSYARFLMSFANACEPSEVLYKLNSPGLSTDTFIDAILNSLELNAYEKNLAVSRIERAEGPLVRRHPTLRHQDRGRVPRCHPVL